MIATNKSSKFKDWEIQLSNGATLTGIAHIPSSTDSTKAKPLLVGIHGATCSAQIYDISPGYTASLYSELLDVPFVAFNRPNFLGSSGWIIDRASSSPKNPTFQPEEGKTSFEEEGRWYHEYIFPALWREFATPNGCTSLVTTSHSMSVPMTIIAATLYSSAQQSERDAGYTWAGMILSGLAIENTQTFFSGIRNNATAEYDASQLPADQDSSIHAPPFHQQDKEDLMLGPPGLCEDFLRPLIWQQNTGLLIEEVSNLAGTWPKSAKDYKARVKIPVLYGLGQYEWIWQGTKSNANSFCAEFSAAPRVEGGVVEGGSHAIDLSPVGRGWRIRCFGWAIEVDAGLKVKEKDLAPFL